MTKLVDVRDLKSPEETHPGSSPGAGTRILYPCKVIKVEEYTEAGYIMIRNIIAVRRTVEGLIVEIS